MVQVPRTLDARARFLFWEIDYVFMAVGGFGIGLAISGWGTGLLIGVLLSHLWARMRVGGGVNKALALLYWHLPFDVFARVPASARRHFLG